MSKSMKRVFFILSGLFVFFVGTFFIILVLFEKDFSKNLRMNMAVKSAQIFLVGKTENNFLTKTTENIIVDIAKLKNGKKIAGEDEKEAEKLGIKFMGGSEEALDKLLKKYKYSYYLRSNEIKNFSEDEIKDLIEKKLKNNKDDVYYNYYSQVLKMKKKKEVLNALGDLVRENPQDDVSKIINEIYSLYSFDEAAKVFKTLINNNKDNYLPYYLFAKYLTEECSKDYLAGAEKLAYLAAIKNTTVDYPLELMADIYNKQQKFDSRIEIVEILFARNPDNKEYFDILNNFYITNKKIDAGKKLVRRFAVSNKAIKPEEVIRYFEEYNDFDGEIEYIEAYFKNTPDGDLSQKHYYTAVLYMKKGENTKALEELNNLVKSSVADYENYICDPRFVEGLNANGEYSAFLKSVYKGELTVGEKVPVITGVLTDGRKVNYDSTSKTAIIFFWKSDDQMSTLAISSMNEVYNYFEEKDVDFVGISLDTVKEDADKTIDFYDTEWESLFSGKGINDINAKKFGVKRYPVTFIVKDGIVKYKGIYSKELIEECVGKLLDVKE